MMKKIKGYRCCDCGTFFPNEKSLKESQEICRKERKGCGTFHADNMIEIIYEGDDE